MKASLGGTLTLTDPHFGVDNGVRSVVHAIPDSIAWEGIGDSTD